MAGWFVRAALVLWLLRESRFSGIFSWEGQRGDGVWRAFERYYNASASNECGASPGTFCASRALLGWLSPPKRRAFARSCTG